RDFESDLSIPQITLPGLEKNDFVNGCRFEKLINAQADATLQALKSQQVPCDELMLDRLDEWHLGALFMMYELLTSLTGHHMKVNTYDQPGVELGKTILVKNFK
ncbi:MAG: glucose-6-phosphate isomerase, partial [Campylobacterales bacterium]